MEEHETLKFGVNIKNNIVYVFEIDDNNRKYDIILIDKVVRNYNGNVSYRVELADGCKPNFLESGWEFRSLFFPGNWRGQNARFELQDKFGYPFESENIITEQWYRQKPLYFIKEALQSALFFSQRNYSTKYYNVVNGREITSLISEKPGYYEFVDVIEHYINDYQDVLLTLIKENAPISFIDKINMSFNEKAKTIFLSNLLKNDRNK